MRISMYAIAAVAVGIAVLLAADLKEPFEFLVAPSTEE